MDDMNSLWGNVFNVRNKKEDTVRGILKRVPIFEELGKRKLDRIERILHRREYAQSYLIIRRYVGTSLLVPLLPFVAGRREDFFFTLRRTHHFMFFLTVDAP